MDFIKHYGVKFEKWVQTSYQRVKVRYRLYNETKIIASHLKGHEKLSEDQKRQIKNFYSKYFKVDNHTYTAHTYYLQKTGVFDIKYIPDPIWYAYIDPFFNNWTLDKYLDNKCYYTRMFPNVKMPKNVFYRLNNFWYDENDKIVTKEFVKQQILNSPTDLFIKNADAYFGCGSGVIYFNPKKTDFSTIEWIFSSRYDYVVQEAIVQHEVLAQINQSSVNTIRSLSLLKRDGTVKIYSSVLRMGRDGSKLDNTGAGGVSCGIDNDGKLKKIGFDRWGERIDKHPDSHFVFENTILPGFDKSIQLIKRIAPTIPHFRLVSWDIAIDQNGEPTLIEINTAYGGPELHQFSNGPIFGEDTEEVLEEVFGSKEK